MSKLTVGVLFAVVMLVALFVPAFAQYDIEPPKVFDLHFEPNPLKVIGNTQVITATLRATDDQSGVERVEVYMEQDPPAYNPLLIVLKNRIVGNAQDGVLQKVYTMPPYGATGTWRVQTIEAFDFAGNSILYYPQWYCDQYGGTDCFDPSNETTLVLIALAEEAGAVYIPFVSRQ
jgi:hypothetical protein